MPLQMIRENLDGLDEPIAALYTETEDGNFVLDVTGVDDHPEVGGLKSALERQKDTNKKLREKAEKLERQVGDLPTDFDAEKWAEYKARIEKLDDDLDDDADKDKLQKLREQLDAKWQAKLDKQKTEYEDKIAELTGGRDHYRESLHRTVKRDELTRALVKHNVRKELMDAALDRHVNKVKVVEDEGELKAVVEADGVEQTVAEYIEGWTLTDEGKAMIVAPKSHGSGDKGGGGPGGEFKNPWSDKHRNLTEQAKIVREDYAKACRLAREAGKPEPRRP